MRAINHALAGAAIGLVVHNPVVALPIAFFSHFVLDAIPHFGIRDDHDLLAKWFKVLLVIDALLCALLVAVLAALHPAYWLLAAGCAFLATSADLLQIKRYVRSLRSGKVARHRDPLGRFHGWVQWFQRPTGVVVEVAWFVGMILILSTWLYAA